MNDQKKAWKCNRFLDDWMARVTVCSGGTLSTSVVLVWGHEELDTGRRSVIAAVRTSQLVCRSTAHPWCADPFGRMVVFHFCALQTRC